VSRGEYEKKDSKNYGELEKETAMGKIPLTGQKGFAVAPRDSLFFCAWLVPRVASLMR
jgi:hypothetical protein